MNKLNKPENSRFGERERAEFVVRNYTRGEIFVDWKFCAKASLSDEYRVYFILPAYFETNFVSVLLQSSLSFF